ncbi:MAG: histidine phosphatase family protein [Candidatus Saccharibacteria bacterium]
MIISFIRHGESEANVNGLLSSKADEPFGLTENGKEQIINTAKNVAKNISAIYSSPLLRTTQSANILIDRLGNNHGLIIDERLAEISYGSFSGQKNNSQLDEVRKKQVAGDHEIRFSETGENKREILTRLAKFLIDALEKHEESDHIMVVSHGTIIMFFDSIISQLETPNPEHVHVNNAEIRKITLNKSDSNKIREIINNLNIC